jgi:hypothetical protein
LRRRHTRKGTRSTNKVEQVTVLKGISVTDPLRPEVVVGTIILRDHLDLIAHA